MLQVLSVKSKGKGWINAVLYGVIFILILLNLLLNLFFKCEISGVSMLNTLQDGQSVILTKAYNRLDVNDTVVFKHSDGRYLIKRVIAVSGQTIAFVASGDSREGGRTVYLYKKCNNKYKRVDEDYIPEPMTYSSFSSSSANVNVVVGLTDTIDEGEIRYSITVGRGHYYVMGDNRNVSFDSRYFGAINNDMLYAKMVYKLVKNSFFERVCFFFYGGEQRTAAED